MCDTDVQQHVADIKTSRLKHNLDKKHSEYLCNESAFFLLCIQMKTFEKHFSEQTDFDIICFLARLTPVFCSRLAFPVFLISGKTLWQLVLITFFIVSVLNKMIRAVKKTPKKTKTKTHLILRPRGCCWPTREPKFNWSTIDHQWFHSIRHTFTW